MRTQHEQAIAPRVWARRIARPTYSARIGSDGADSAPPAHNDSVVHLDNAVFLVGAGISRDPPASLETADQMVQRLAAELTYAPGLRRYRTALARAVGRLRLELVLDLLVSTIGPGVVGWVFAPMRHSLPNFNHLALVSTGRPIVTTNQDVLLERAATQLKRRPLIVHLHGTCTHPRRIIARLSQYLHGLPPDEVRAVRQLVQDRTLVVMGYSGRDLDVMQLLLSARPSLVIWVNPDRRRIGREVRVLKRQLGDRFQWSSEPAAEWLDRTLPATVGSELHARVARTGSSPKPPLVGTLLGRRRLKWPALAAASLLERGRSVDLAIEVVEALSLQHDPDVLLALGRFQLQKDQYDLALRYNDAAIRCAHSAPQHVTALQGEVEALRRSSEYTGAYAKLLELTDVAQRSLDSEARGWAENARAGLLRMEGHAIAAHCVYRKAERAFNDANYIDGLIEARTWIAENYLQVGATGRALSEARAVLADTDDFSRYFTAGWPLFVIGEGLIYSGQLVAALKSLRSAQRRFRAAKNESGLAWVALLLAASVKADDPLRAAHWLDEAEDHLRGAQKHGWNWIHVESRLLLERADLARMAYDNAIAERALISLDQRLAGLSRDQPIIRLHRALAAAEMARTRRDPRAAAQLSDTAAGYRRLGLVAPAARAAVGAHLAQPPALATPRLMQLCAKYFPLEAQRLRSGDGDHYPIYFV